MTFSRLPLALAIAALAPLVHAETRYTARLLAAPAGTKSVNALSAGGAVLGSIETSTTPTVVKSYVLGDDGQLVFQVPGVRRTEARAMSSAGHVAGAILRHDGFVGGSYLRRPDGSIATFAVDGAYETAATGVNAAGTVAGWSKAGSPPRPTAFMWRDGAFTALPSPYLADGDSAVNAINDAGDMVGTASFDAYHHHATLWHADGSAVKFFDLPRGGDCEATSLSATGLVAGSCSNSPSTARGALWRSTTSAPQALMPPAGDANSWAHAVNAAGVVVGESAPVVGRTHAVIWRDGVPADLQTLTDLPAGVTLESAWSVSDDGRILAYARKDDAFYALLLTPSGH